MGIGSSIPMSTADSDRIFQRRSLLMWRSASGWGRFAIVSGAWPEKAFLDDVIYVRHQDADRSWLDEAEVMSQRVLQGTEKALEGEE